MPGIEKYPRVADDDTNHLLDLKFSCQLQTEDNTSALYKLVSI